MMYSKLVKWLGQQDLNLRMRESKSRALPLGYTPTEIINGVNSGTRTHDFQSHNLALYQLNYIHHIVNGTPEGIRTPDTRLRRAVLYPAELLVHNSPKIIINGAGDGNRTHATSLEGQRSTIELHPHVLVFISNITILTHLYFNVKFFFSFFID